jgi:hypothetical protein
VVPEILKNTFLNFYCEDTFYIPFMKEFPRAAGTHVNGCPKLAGNLMKKSAENYQPQWLLENCL